MLLLFISCSAMAKPIDAQKDFSEKGTLSLNEARHTFHKNMLQPQTLHVTIANEHPVKSISLGYAVLFLQEQTVFAVKARSKTTAILQDENRCESVSKLLFPFHNFW